MSLSNIKLFFKNKLVLSGVSGLLILIFCYHNDTIYSFILDKEYRIIRVLNILGRNTDIIGGVKKITSPLDDNDVIELKIKKKQFKKLKSGIHLQPRVKKWAKASIKVNNEFVNVKVKFHGTQNTHYNNNKYSYTIKKTGEELLINGWSNLKLIKGGEVNPAIISINKLANELGLISSYGSMKMLKINGENKGYYYLEEQLKEKLIEKKYGMQDVSILRNTSNWTRKEGFGYHMTDLDFNPGHIREKSSKSFPKALARFKKLGEVLESNNREGIIEFFDPDYMGKFLAMAALFNEVHFMTGDNLKLVFDNKSGKFFPVFRAEYVGRVINKEVNYPIVIMNFDKFLFDGIDKTYSNSKTSKLFKTLLSNDKVFQKRNLTLFNFIKTRESITKKIEDVYEKANSIYIHSSTSRRAYHMLKIHQLNILNTILDKATEYLSYAHIYGTFNKNTNLTSITADVFSPVQFYYGDSLLINKDWNGIKLNPNLTLSYNQFEFGQSGFNLDELTVINLYTGDTIKEHNINIVSIGD